MVNYNVHVFSFFMASIALNSSFTIANATNDGERSPATWGREWELANHQVDGSEKGFTTLSHCVVVQKKDNAYKVLPLDPKEALSKSFLDTPDEDSIATILEINKVISNTPKPENTVHACERSLESVAKCFNVDSILDISEKTWKLNRYEHTTKKLSVVLEGPAGKSDQYFNWIQKQLNYDGVILDEKEGFLLALLPNRSYGTETQALTMNNSFDKIVLTSAKNKGSSLLQLQKQEGRYAIFQVVIAKTDGGIFTPGTKIILEKGKKKTFVSPDSPSDSSKTPDDSPSLPASTSKPAEKVKPTNKPPVLPAEKAKEKATAEPATANDKAVPAKPVIEKLQKTNPKSSQTKSGN